MYDRPSLFCLKCSIILLFSFIIYSVNGFPPANFFPAPQWDVDPNREEFKQMAKKSIDQYLSRSNVDRNMVEIVKNDRATYQVNSKGLYKRLQFEARIKSNKPDVKACRLTCYAIEWTLASRNPYIEQVSLDSWCNANNKKKRNGGDGRRWLLFH